MGDTDPTVVASAEKAIEHKSPIIANIPWRARIAILALILVIIVLLAEAINGQAENRRLSRQYSEEQARRDKDRQSQIANLASLLIVVQQGVDQANAHGVDPKVTVEQAVNALKRSGFTQEVIDQAIKRAILKPGPAGPQGPPGPQGRSAEVPNTTSTTRMPSATTSSTTTSTTQPGRTSTTTTTRPCAVNLLGVKLGC